MNNSHPSKPRSKADCSWRGSTTMSLCLHWDCQNLLLCCCSIVITCSGLQSSWILNENWVMLKSLPGGVRHLASCQVVSWTESDQVCSFQTLDVPVAFKRIACFSFFIHQVFHLGMYDSKRYSEIPLLRPPKIKTSYLLKNLFAKFKLFFSSFSTPSVHLIRDQLWDCPKVVFKTTFGQTQRWS